MAFILKCDFIFSRCWRTIRSSRGQRALHPALPEWIARHRAVPVVSSAAFS